MKLIIQIPCYNEEHSLAGTLECLPKSIPGIDRIELLVIDDGSTDATAQVARRLNVAHIVQLPRHVGLAQAFVAGLEASIRAGADIIVNTDADNQYRSEDTPRLIQPILARKAEIVVGDRGVGTISGFSPLKRRLQLFGSWVVGHAAGMDIPDATSGFRAFSRDAALRTIVLSEYSYTLETLIQAGTHQLSVAHVPVGTNQNRRASRLMRSMRHYVMSSGATILRAYTMYRPMRVFFLIGSLMLAGGIALGVRFLYFFVGNDGNGHIQSLILSAVLLIVGFQVGLIGLLADLIGFNRRILEETLYRVRKLELEPKKHEDAPESRATGA